MSSWLASPAGSGGTSNGMGLGIAGLGGIAGAYGNQSNTSGNGTTNGTSTTTPNLSPELQALIDQIMKQAGGLTTPSLSGYQAQQTQGINHNADLQSQSVNNIMASRGLATSPVAGTAQAGVEQQRFGQINQMNEGLPLLQNQMNLQNLGAASSAASMVPKGSTTSGNQTTTNSGNQTQGGGVGGAVGGIASILASLFSDKRLKEDIKDIPSDKAVTKILALRPSSWKWKGTEVEDSGILAQDVERVMPELIDKQESGLLKVNYAGLIGTMLSAIQGLATSSQEAN